jgi:hypothetical protein
MACLMEREPSLDGDLHGCVCWPALVCDARLDQNAWGRELPGKAIEVEDAAAKDLTKA